MGESRRIKVLIVDDSLMFREVLSRGISQDPMIEVVAVAGDPFEASDQIVRYQPDVITCDIEMPRMDGIEFVRRLLPQYPIAVIMVSSVSAAVFDAMEAGAVDFVVKPQAVMQQIEQFIQELIFKIKIAGHTKPIRASGRPASETAVNKTAEKMANCRMIVIGASTGGTEALYQLLKCLPTHVPGIVIVQHIPPVFSRMFAERLNQKTGLSVKEATTGDAIEPGRVLIAPGDQHIIVKRSGQHDKVECFSGDKVSGHCPSVDLLFDSAAQLAGAESIGIILTGMGNDGARGLLALRKRGGRTIGQDERSSVVYGMPKAAFDLGAVERQAALENIPGILLSLLKG